MDLTVHFISPALLKMDEVSLMLDKQERNFINRKPWPVFPYAPEVSFSIAHYGEGIYLKYFVKEKHAKAKHFGYNTPVYEDSCVEFFIAFEGSTAYYNLEINCTGSILMGYGNGKNERLFIPEEKLKMIDRQVCMFHSGSVDAEWQLILMLPAEIFQFEELNTFNGVECKANFYKCGDLLPDPHFLCWSPITAPEPDFHLPAFFGKLHFE